MLISLQRKFTKREKEILAEVVQGARSAQIAKKLNLSLFTVQTHRKNILKNRVA